MEQDRLDFRAALIAAAVANTVPRKKGRRAFTPADFMSRREKKKQTPEQMLHLVEVLNAAFGGKDERKRGPRK